MVFIEWFRSVHEAKRVQAERGGLLLQNTPRSPWRFQHNFLARCYGVDPDVYRFSVYRVKEDEK